MSKPNWNNALKTISFLAIVAAFAANAQAELVKQKTTTTTAIEEDAITPEADESEEEVVIIKKAKPKTVVKRVTREETEITPPLATELPAEAAAPVPAATKPSMGSQLDEGVKNKMVDVQSKFEEALLKTLDKIKITIDDGTVPQGSSTPTDSAVIQDSFTGTQGAADKAGYMPLDAAPVVADEEEHDHEMSAGSSVATIEKPKSERKVRVAPVFGRTNIGSSSYNISPRYTAGVEIEMDMDKSLALVMGYSYSQYDISLGNSGSFYNYYQPYGFNGGGMNNNSLEYNQNVFSGGMRVYLMPPESKFRIFGGAGVGYNVGYLNYRSNTVNQNAYMYNPYFSSPDYEVKSWLGLLEGGALFNVSESVSLGALFKYAFVFSASENAPLNNYAFTGNNFGYGQSTNKDVVGGSLARDNFYSILGTVKVAF